MSKVPNENFAFENLRISRVFSKFDGGFNLSNKRSNYELRFPPQLRRTQKRLSFSFLAIFDNSTCHRVTKFYPVSHINITYKFYLITFSLTQNFFFSFFIYAIATPIYHGKQGGVVGKAADGKFEIPSSSLATVKLIFFFFFIPSAFAEHGEVFAQKKPPHFFEILLHKLQIR